MNEISGITKMTSKVDKPFRKKTAISSSLPNNKKPFKKRGE